MIRTITINYTTRDFFGHEKLNSDRLDYNITPQVVDKVCKAVASGKAHAAHFIHDNGQVDGVYRDYDDVEPGQVTWRHDYDKWNYDAPTKTTIREFKRKMKAELA